MIFSSGVNHTIMNRILLITIAFLGFLPAWAQDFPPAPNRLVSDYTNTLTPQEVQHLEQKLVAFDDSTSTQIAVVIMQSVGGYDIADYGVRLAQQWGIGSAENDNGILLLVAIGDRRVTIQTGYGVEGAVPDVVARRIIQNEITPAFRQEAYFQGIDRATDALISYTKGEYNTPRRINKDDHSGIPIIIVLMIIVVVVALISRSGGGGGKGGEMMGSRGVSDVFWWSVLSGMSQSGRRGGGGGFGGGGFGGGGFGGGGFGGFGGGGFGGGGASGSW